MENFRQMVPVFFFGGGGGTENRNGFGLPPYCKIPAKFSLFLDMKPGTSNPNKWYRKFRSFR